MQGHQPHTLPDPLLHPLDDGVAHPLVSCVSPPGQDVRLGENFVGQSMFRLIQRCDADSHFTAELPLECIGPDCMHSLRINLSHRFDQAFVNELIPEGDTKRRWHGLFPGYELESVALT